MVAGRKVGKSQSVWNWEDFVDEEVVNQLQKKIGINVQVPECLAREWNYAYCIGWFYSVCESYFTADEGKSMWNEIKFDEHLFLNDMAELVAGVTTADDGNMYYDILEQLLRTVSQNKYAVLEDWDGTIKYHIGQDEDLEFYAGDVGFWDLSRVEQFRVLYKVVKRIERKSIAFRNYSLNYGHLFQFPQVWTSEHSSLIVLPGCKIVRKEVTKSNDAALRIPIKLLNCTLRYEDESREAVEIVHYDFSQEIDSYVRNINVTYRVEAYDWFTFLEYIRNTEDENVKDFLSSLVQYAANNELHGLRLWNIRTKERSMQDLITRRKRSSRLVAREEEAQRKILEDAWNDKLDDRDRFLRLRYRLVAKRIKQVKDAIWAILWEKFQYDKKVEKIKGRTTEKEELSDTEQEENFSDLLTSVEENVLAYGETFTSPIVIVKEPECSFEAKSEEIPQELCITNAELIRLADHGIATDNFRQDIKDWYFQCLCGAEGINIEPGDEIINNMSIVCCDKCMRWQHWDCQNKKALELLFSAQGKLLTSKDFALVSLAVQQSRRTLRRATNSAELTQDSDRPTMKRGLITDSEPFVCSWCIAKFEKDLRSIFKSELIATRTKEKKQAAEKEKRKLAKEKKRKDKLSKQLQDSASLNQSPFYQQKIQQASPF